MKVGKVEIKNKNTGTGTGTGMGSGGTADQKAEEILRISISRTAEEALTAMVERVNDGFEAGKVNRTQIANWVLIQAREALTDAQIKDIRAEHLDEFAFFESLMRKAKKSGKIPSELRSFMNKQLGLDDTPKKRKKILQDDVRNDDVTNENSA